MIKGGTFREFTRNVKRFSLLELDLVKDYENNSSATENPPYPNIFHLYINKTVSIQVYKHTFSDIFNAEFSYIVSFVGRAQLQHDSENNNSSDLHNDNPF